MILNLILYLCVTSVEGGRVYKRRNISEQAWSGVDTGISINSERLDSVLMDSIMTAKLQCSIECDNNKLCGLFQLLEGEGLSCILAQLYYWTFEEQFTGPEVEVYIRKDRMVDAGREVSIDEEIFIFFLYSVHGAWSDWSDWSSCNTYSCGHFTPVKFTYSRYKLRYCSNPAPQHGGKVCNGSSYVYEDNFSCTFETTDDFPGANNYINSQSSC